MRGFVRQLVPWSVRTAIRRRLARLTTQRLLRDDSSAPVWLDAAELPVLQRRYAFPPEYGYDPESLASRGAERAVRLLRLAGDRRLRSFLEIGCWDGMVSCMLQRAGKQATAIDRRDEGFDERAVAEGVTFRTMDAARLDFPDAQFDSVFSYDTFEHVARPDAVLAEAVRVVRPGGIVFLAFGPLYRSPFGEHAYRTITVPYCQFLFQKPVLNAFAAEEGLPLIDFDHVNGWSLARFRSLWSSHPEIERVLYREYLDTSHLDLVRRYPACFRRETNDLDELITASIEVLFEKRG